ncbi:MAG TPA: DUF2634 domain-containing protein [Clostridiales bacterium]|nr:DUF2634 domain-containing protein [Clostridiales bacterium]
MIPNTSMDVTVSTTDTIETSKTYKIISNTIQGYIDDNDALLQAIYKVLNTEKYEYPIYSFSYGIELENLIGQDKLYVQMELSRRIKECLLEDERITSVENFVFSFLKDSILCIFDVVSIYGKNTISKAVST